MAFDVIVCGSLHLDIVVKAPALPRIDETAIGSGWEQVCGGKGGNQAVQSARAGSKTALIGRIGKDAFAKTLIENLARCNVHHAHVSTDPLIGSGMSVAILQDDGNYGAVIVSGANAALDPAKVPDLWQELGGAKVLVLQNEVPEAVNLAAVRVAARDGALIVFNAAPMRTMARELLRDVDVLVLNRVEAEVLAGLKVDDFASARKAVAKLNGMTRSVVITLGGVGVLVAPSQGPCVEIAAMPVTVTSTHGAGDCFVGVLAAALAKGTSLVDACQTANRHAAAFVSRH